MNSLEIQITREHNVVAAQVVAMSLNGLIDRGVLTTQHVSGASARIMDEFVVRNTDQIKSSGFPTSDAMKLQTLFGVPTMANSIQREPRGTKVADLARGVLAKIRDTDPDIQGFLVFGSRMDKEKLPRDTATQEITDDDPTGGMSDIDVFVFTLPTSGDSFGQIMNTRPTHWQMEEIKKNMYPDVTAQFGRSSILHIFELYDLITGKEKDFEFPDWGWNPDGVQYVGDLRVPEWMSVSGKEEFYSEEQVNEMIQTFLIS